MSSMFLPILEAAVGGGAGSTSVLDPLMKQFMGGNQAQIPPINAPFETPQTPAPQPTLPEVAEPVSLDPNSLPADPSMFSQANDQLKQKTGMTFGGKGAMPIIDSSAGLSAVGDVSAPMSAGSDQYVQTLQSLLNWG